MNVNLGAIKSMLDDGYPVVVFLPKPKGKREDVLDDVLGRLEELHASARKPAKARGRRDDIPTEPARRCGAKKAWSRDELLALALLRRMGERGAMHDFAQKTGRTYMSVRNKSSMLGGGSPGRNESRSKLDDRVLTLIESRPDEAEDIGRRALLSLCVGGLPFEIHCRKRC